MGVSGTGKSTVARELAEHLGWVFAEGDSLHPPANIDKMSAGTPLDDDDRAPWLDAISRLIASHHDRGLSSVVTCSSLKRGYRETLRSRVDDDTVFFLHLAAPFAVLLERMESRDHFMPATLLRSQFETLQPLADDETGAVIDVALPLDDVVAASIEAVGRW